MDEKTKNNLNDPDWWFDDGYDDSQKELCPFAKAYIEKVKKELECMKND